MGSEWGDRHRLLPGVVPGWGMSWWFAEQGVWQSRGGRDDQRAVVGARVPLRAGRCRRLVAGRSPVGVGRPTPSLQGLTRPARQLEATARLRPLTGGPPP